MEITVYKKDGSERTIVHIDERSKETKKFRQEDYVKLLFNLTEYVDFELGDYVQLNSIDYKLNQLPKVVKNSTTDYEYSCRFESPLYDLLNVIYKDNDDNIEHYLSGKVDDFVDLIVTNLNRVYGSSTWSKNILYSGYFKNLHFEASNCLEALQRVCDEFNVDFRIDSKTITVDESIGSDTGITLSYGSGNGLYQITRQRVDSNSMFTRLWARGSDRNISKDYGFNRLKLPDIDGDGSKDDYIENNTGTYGIIEKSVIFDDIYPSIKSVSGAGVVDSSANDNTFVDADLDFDINSYLIDGKTPKIRFDTGDLAGHEFEIDSYDHSNNRINLVPFTDDQGNTLPNDTLNAATGDEYKILGIKLPTSYIDSAETELKNDAQTYLNNNSTPRVKYNVEITPHEFESNPYQFVVGDWVTIDDPKFGSKYVQIIKRSKTLIENAAAGFSISIEATDTEENEISLSSVHVQQQRINRTIKTVVKDIEYKEFQASGTEENSFRIGDGTSGDKKLVFNADVDHTIKWDESASRYEVDDKLNVQGQITQNGNNVINTTNINSPLTVSSGNVDLLFNNPLYDNSGSLDISLNNPVYNNSGNIDIYRNNPIYNNSGNLDIYNHGNGQRGVLNDGSTSQSIYGSKTFDNNLTAKEIVEGDNYSSGILGKDWRIDPNMDGNGRSFFEVDSMRVRGALRVHIFKKDIVRASNGFLYISDSSEIADQVTTPSTTGTSFTITVKEQVFNSGDRLWYKDIDMTDNSLAVYSVKVDVTDNGTSRTLNNETVYDYSADLVSGTDVTLKAGDTVVRISGPTILNDASSTYAPFLEMREGQNSLRTRLGNLNGSYGYTSNIYGLAAGDPNNEHITIDSTNGFRMFNGSGTKVAELTGDSFYVGTSGSSNQLSYDGSTLDIISDTFTLNAGSGDLKLDSSVPEMSLDGGKTGVNGEITANTDWRFWAGNTTPGSAPFRVDENGSAYFSKATLITDANSYVKLENDKLLIYDSGSASNPVELYRDDSSYRGTLYLLDSALGDQDLYLTNRRLQINTTDAFDISFGDQSTIPIGFDVKDYTNSGVQISTNTAIHSGTDTYTSSLTDKNILTVNRGEMYKIYINTISNIDSGSDAYFAGEFTVEAHYDSFYSELRIHDWTIHNKNCSISSTGNTVTLTTNGTSGIDIQVTTIKVSDNRGSY